MFVGWYQESGRAGRDNKYSFCRVYYDRSDVSRISYLLHQDIAKASDKKLEKAKQALKEFVTISQHCESTKCRHQFFTAFFGDNKPDCKNMCDVCKNKKQCEKKLESFMSIASDGSLGSYNQKPDLDPEDLYEGGRSKHNGLDKESFENYDDSGGSDHGFRKASEAFKNNEREFILKQLALRKAQAAQAMEQLPATQMSRVKAAQSTEIKVVGLDITKRDKNLGYIADYLKQNMENSAKLNPPEYPEHKLIYRDFEDIAKEIEYKCFDTCKALSIYIRNIAKASWTIRNCVGLYADLKKHVPKKRQDFGGDSKTILKQYRERYGSDVIDDLDSEKSKKSERVKKNKLQQSGRDGKIQTSINSFLSTTPNKSPDINDEEQKSPVDVKDETVEIVESSEDSSSDSELIKLQLIQKALQDELNQTTEELEIREKETFHMKPQISKIYEVDDEADEGQLVIDEGPIDKGDGFAIESMKRKFEHSGNQAAAASPAKKLRPNEPSSRPREDVKKAISELVRHQLTPFYKRDKIVSSDSKTLFKAIARKVTHHFFDKFPNRAPSKDIIKSYIKAVFDHKTVITEADDFTLE